MQHVKSSREGSNHSGALFFPLPRNTMFYREIEKFRGDATEINFSIIERSDYWMHLLSLKNNDKADFEGAECAIYIYLSL